VVVAYVVCAFILFVPAIAYSGSPVGISVTHVIAAVWRPMTASLLAAAIGFTLRFTLLAEMSAVLKIIVLSFAYMTAYVTVVVGFLGERTGYFVSGATLPRFGDVRVVA
jgi:hypothetical protein